MPTPIEPQDTNDPARRLRIGGSPAEQAALDWINSARDPIELVEEYEFDPAVEKPKPPRELSYELAKTMLIFRDDDAQGTLKELIELKALPEVTDAVLADLLHTGSQMAGEQPPPPQIPAIGVLLPVRLETRFYPPEAAGLSWRLCLRIIPDRASLDDHDPLASRDELESVELFWQQADGDINSDAAAKAWPLFVSRHGGPRANWLARAFPPVMNGDGTFTIDWPAEVNEDPATTHLRGFPATIDVWIARGGTGPQLAAQLAVDHGLVDFSLPDFDAGDDTRWWTSFDQALAAGLAAEIDLGQSLPNDIDALYVVGLSQETPDDLFRDHVDAGLLAPIAPGSPTNTVHGEPAADLAQNGGVWLDLLRNPPDQTGASQISQTLTGDPDRLLPLPDGDTAARFLNQNLVRALWPVLWGHPFKDILGLGAAVHKAGLWAGDNLIPEGPSPALRIGSVPYGLLPTSSLVHWTPDNNDPAFEVVMADHLARLRADWRAAAETAGNVENADTAQLLDLLSRTASSRQYAWRNMTSLEQLLGVFLGGAFGFVYDHAIDWWEDLASVPLSYPIDPQRHFIASGWPQDLAIPLVMPDNLPPGVSFTDVIEMIRQTYPGQLADGTLLHEAFDDKMLNSLLIRLLWAARVMAAAEVVRATREDVGPMMEHLSLPDEVTQLQRDAQMFDVLPPGLAASDIYLRLQDALQAIAETPVEMLERAFKAVLDTAIYRIDPWITGYSWRRLEALIDQKYPMQLGIYGWVDNPKPGTPGPTEGGLLHAPSPAQAFTSIVLRDKAINDPQTDRWQMDLTSSAIRTAARLADEVRLGQHLHIVIGREVERIVADPELIKRLRDTYRLRQEHAGRRVCNGKAVLDAAEVDLTNLGLTTLHFDQFDALREALNAYGDLLIAEGVYHVVSGRTEMAGAAMDAAAGMATPPELEVLQTPRSGRSVATTVAFCLPGASGTVAPTATASPTALADPSLVRWLFNQTASAAGSIAAAFNWDVVQRINEVTTTVNVTLDDVGLRVYDTAVLSPGLLHQLVLDQVDGGLEIVPGAAGDASHQQILEMITMIGGRPALPENLVAPGDTAPDAGPVLVDLRSRLENLRTSAAALIAFMNGTLTGSTNAQKGAMRNAARWGIVPQTSARRSLPEQVSDAIDALTERLNQSPDPAQAAEMDAAELARAIAELVSPEGRYPVMTLIDRGQLPTEFSRSPQPSPSELSSLDAEWLSVNSPVRPALARLEAFQLDKLLDDRPVLASWSNRPGDPWQQNAPPDPISGLVPDTGLIVAYGTTGTLQSTSATVAFCLIDAWNEVVPATAHVTTAAFGFDAPAARA
ncbi:MAG: hypothetical protein KDI55_01450, partial [Anaerolineae bacterium]|nr:hypothetical protein [Anaerolineae bacterium]